MVDTKASRLKLKRLWVNYIVIMSHQSVNGNTRLGFTFRGRKTITMSPPFRTCYSGHALVWGHMLLFVTSYFGCNDAALGGPIWGNFLLIWLEISITSQKTHIWAHSKITVLNFKNGSCVDSCTVTTNLIFVRVDVWHMTTTWNVTIFPFSYWQNSQSLTVISASKGV